MSYKRAAAAATATVALLASPAPARTETRPVLSTRAGEFQPARGPEHLAWERNTARRPGHFDVYVRARKGRKVRVNPRGTMAANGGSDGGRGGDQQRRGRGSDNSFYQPGQESPPGPPPGGSNPPRG